MSENYTHEVTLDNEHAQVMRVHLAPGHATKPHSHPHPYVLHPLAATKVRKTVYKDGQVVETKEFDHEPGKPYFVGASEDGTSFVFENIGSGPMMCDKTFIKK
jgi:hypothetical protein